MIVYLQKVREQDATHAFFKRILQMQKIKLE